MASDKAPAAHLRITFAPNVSLGPGKARLLEGIRDLGSIAAAGRRMGMSYK
ncbi:MAG: winged helix-turn-helix domain-containing protein, partial [Alphaproteobacteria bacterium]